MQLVTTPVVFVAMAVLLSSQIAFPWQVFQHLRQCHAPLPLQTRILVRYVGSLAAWKTLIWATAAALGPTGGIQTSGEFCFLFGMAASNPALLFHLGATLLQSLCPLRPCFRKSLASLDGCRISGDVPNQTILLGLANQCFMHKTRQLHARKFIECP